MLISLPNLQVEHHDRTHSTTPLFMTPIILALLVIFVASFGCQTGSPPCPIPGNRFASLPNNHNDLAPSSPSQEDVSVKIDELEFSAVGSYEPGFIHLHIATQEDLSDLNRLAANGATARWVATFLHEYIHFLQDTTSTQGLLNFILVVDNLKNANKQVRDNPIAKFSTPLKISNEYNWVTNMNLRKLYIGDDKPVERVMYLAYAEIKVEVRTYGGEVIHVTKYEIHYYDKGAYSHMKCHFGSIHLKEYMAYAIQKQFAPETSNSDIPYALVELLIQKEHPPLATDTAFMVALCDAALMHYHPAQLFFDALTRMQKVNWIPTGVDSVYAFAYDGVEFSWAGQTETIDSMHEKSAALAIEYFRDSLSGEIFQMNVLWFEEIIKAARHLRSSRRGFITQVVHSPWSLSPVFSVIFKLLGTPFMTNAAQKGYFHAPEALEGLNIQPYYPKVFQAICRTYQGKEACGLHAFCETRSDKIVTNDQCLTSPWERVDLPELCPYAQMWKHWGLKGKIPVITP